MATSVKKIIAVIMCAVVLSGGLMVPRQTYAIPVVDFLLNALTGSNAATSAANWATQLAKWAKDELAKTMRDAIVKAIVNEINKQTVAWIQGKGKPKFVSDWKGFIQGAATDAVNQTISQSKLADLCTPFAPQLRVALIPETQPISQQAKCTITDIVKNVQGFYDNFKNGGWLAYGEAIKPENNLYMQLVMFGDETKLKTNLNQETKKQEAGAGSGFLSVSKCVADNAQDLYDECVAGADVAGQAAGATDCYAYAAAAATCTKTEVQTPGDAVAGTVRNLIGSDNMYVSGVQSIISAAINAGINRLMTEGLNLMTGNEHPEKGFNPATQYQSELDAMASSTKSQLKGAIMPTYDRWKALIDIKNTSATYNAQLATNLNTIKTIQDGGTSCPPSVTQSEKDAVNQMAAKLAGDIGILQPKVTDAEKILADIATLDTNNIRQSSIVNDEITAFSAKYIADNPSSTTGTPFIQQKQDALDEQGGINGRLMTALTRLQTCKDAQTAAASTAATQ